jgi:hypothetical protein
MVPYSKAHTKGKVHKNGQNRYEAQPSEFSINGTTEKQHIPDLVQALMPVPSREYDSCFLVSHLVMS